MGRASRSRVRRPQLRHEREHFRKLLLANPNYFGNLTKSDFKPVVNIQGNTTYEALRCIGYQPEFSRLEAVIHLNESWGYGGDLCRPGTTEFVRFYLSYDSGGTWEDLGLAGFAAHDLPGDKPLEYGLSLDIGPRLTFCFRENLPEVRGILSWNVAPPANSPDYLPVWGNVLNAHIQIQPRHIYHLGVLLEEAKVKLPIQLEPLIDLSHEFEAPHPTPADPQQLHASYKETKVPDHRFLFPAVQQLSAESAGIVSTAASAIATQFPWLKIDAAAVLGKLLSTNGNTAFEELQCVGLDPNQSLLQGVLRLKLSSGYSGNLCSQGSREYVAFWADWGDGTGWTYAGTGSVGVHDITNLPARGLEYAVFLPVDLTARRQPCEDGAKTVRVRAILSWEAPPPASNPEYVPTWGNRQETLVHIPPGPAIPSTSHLPLIETIGSMWRDDIDAASGLASGAAQLVGFSAYESPFGGEVVLTGHIANPPDISSGAVPLKYKVSVSNDGGATWQPLSNSFTLKRSQLLNGIWTALPDVNQAVDGAGWYTYYEDLSAGPGNAQVFVVGNLLARWQTAGSAGLWYIKIEATDGVSVQATLPKAVYLDNEPPTAQLEITTGGGNCADFTIGQDVSGTYKAHDEHFGSLSLSVEPALGGTFTAPIPLPRAYAIVPTTGEDGSWTLNTSGMPRCGYVVRLDVVDRTIVNSGWVGLPASDVQGLCLREA